MVLRPQFVADTSIEEKRDFSLRKPTTSQERGGKKRRRLAPFEMTVAVLRLEFEAEVGPGRV